MDVQQQAKELDAPGKCVICHEKSCKLQRGLCSRDYSRYRSALMRIPEDRRDAFDEMLIEEGRLLPSRQGRRGGPDNDVFSDAVNAFHYQSTHSKDLDAEAEELIDDTLAKAASKKTPKKRAKKT